MPWLELVTSGWDLLVVQPLHAAPSRVTLVLQCSEPGYTLWLLELLRLSLDCCVQHTQGGTGSSKAPWGGPGLGRVPVWPGQSSPGQAALSPHCFSLALLLWGREWG